ncbi:DNA polymerase phi-domain-containing protein [Calycina marina]|uniref:DNA polymerase phi-domain-containing protein n=1 Tax=Calycina marina TaxID=1763456 RepID=A0A9P7Z1U5_9HELO|nr:DNA polymerase phi-domain-containing protein [Calycina marina]
MGSKRKRSNQEPVQVEQPAKKLQRSSKPAQLVSFDNAPFLDQPDRKSTEFKREVETYGLLADENEAQRLIAASAVVLGLLGGEGVELSTLQRHFERRLFRGLASGARAARLGFSIAITEILMELFGKRNLAETKYKGMTFEKVLGILLEKTKPDGDLSGQEEKDHALGLLFGLHTFVKANILFHQEDRWFIILDKLLELSNRKPWLREECGAVIVQAVSQMNASQAEKTLDKLIESGLAISPEGVGIWVTARDRFPDMKYPSKPWGPTGQPLDRLQTLSKALKESAINEQGSKNLQQAKQTGNWNPQLHFVWDIVLAKFLASLKQKDRAGAKSNFENFWKIAVDENLFSTTASRERKYWGFLLFQKVLQNPSSYAKLFPYIFSHNLVRCLINHSQDADRFLHRSAERSLKVLTQTVASTPNALPAILPRLVSGHGVYSFDRMTKSKTVESMLASVNNKNAMDVIQILLEPVLNVTGSEAEKDADTKRTILGDYLLAMIPKVQDLDGAHWIDEALLLMANFSYSDTLTCSPPLSQKTRELFRNRLTSSFTRLVSDIKGYVYPCSLLSKFAPDAIQMDADITKVKDYALLTLEKILKNAKKAKAKNQPPLQALALIYGLVIFQLYNSETESVSILDELKLCYNKLVRHKESEDDADVDASEVLVELLLSLVAKPSALLRKVAQHVFQAFMADITEGGLQLMTDVLGSGESLRGQQELFDQQPEDGEDMEDGSDNEGDSDIEMDSDVEIIDFNDSEGHLIGHLTDSSDAGEKEEDEEDEEESCEESEDESFKNDDEIQKLNAALALALGTHSHDPAAPAAEHSDSDADMTDSEMMALDSKLIEIFSARKNLPNKKQEAKNAKETMVNFKSRVLDLLEIYVKKQASNPLAMGILLPTLRLIRTTNAKPLINKAHGIISALQKASKEANKRGMGDIEEQLMLIREIHGDAAKNQSRGFAMAASTACIIVALNVWRHDKDNIGKVAAIYSGTSSGWMKGDLTIQPEFLTGWHNWVISIARSK